MATSQLCVTAAIIFLVYMCPSQAWYRNSGSYCGRVRYNPRFKMCCKGLLFARSGRNPICCGAKGIDGHVLMCCSGQVVKKSGKKPSCCGIKGYDAEVAICCNGTVKKRQGNSSTCPKGTKGKTRPISKKTNVGNIDDIDEVYMY